MKPSPKNRFDFRMFMALKPLFQTIYFGEVLMQAIERDQGVFESIIEKLKEWKPRTEDNISDKNNVLKNAQNLYGGRKMIINAFTINYFHYILEIIMKNLKNNHQRVKIDKNHQSVKAKKNQRILNKLMSWINFMVPI